MHSLLLLLYGQLSAQFSLSSEHKSGCASRTIFLLSMSAKRRFKHSMSCLKVLVAQGLF